MPSPLPVLYLANALESVEVDPAGPGAPDVRSQPTTGAYAEGGQQEVCQHLRNGCKFPLEVHLARVGNVDHQCPGNTEALLMRRTASTVKRTTFRIRSGGPPK